MRTAEELIRDAKAALEEDDVDEVVEIVCEALVHLKEFSWKCGGEEWEWSDVKDCCHEIGELIYEHGEFDEMKDVYEEVYYEMKPLAARYLERSWNGCGDGAWRA